MSMDTNTTAQTDLAMLADDVAALRRDLATLMTHVKDGGLDMAADTARDALQKIGDEARQIYRSIASESERSLGAVGRRVEEQPFLSVMIAFGVGLIGGRLLSR